MKLQLKHLSGLKISIEIEANLREPDKLLSPKYFSEVPELLLIFKKQIEQANGVYGHLVDPDRISLRDLIYACTVMPSFELKENIKIPPEILPQGAKT
jgi:hypothetical protein